MNIELQKYKGKATRHTCPACGKRYSFVLYIDTTTGQPINSTVGRCNRESSCGYHYTPKQYFEDRGLNRPKFTNFAKPPEPVRPIGLLPVDLLNKSRSTKSHFVAFLSTLFSDGTLIQNVCDKYHIGATKQHEVVFWQIDTINQVRSGKIMQYNPETGKRSKTQSTDWVHSRMIKAGELNADFNLKQCFFGEHLLSSNPMATVAIVESEKTAMIAAVLMPNFVWLAAGALQGLNIEKCKSLSGRNVILFPDLSEKRNDRMTAFEVWSAKGSEIMKAYKCKVIVSDLLEKYANDRERQSGFDIADYLINEMRTKAHQAPATVDAPVETSPFFNKSDLSNSPTVDAPNEPEITNLNLSDIALQVIGERNHLSEKAIIDKLIQMYQINETRAENGLKSLIDSKLIEPTHIGTYVLSWSTPF